MADVISLPQRQGTVLDQYRHLLTRASVDRIISSRAELVPLDELAVLRRELEASLTPAARNDIAKAVAVLMASCKIPNGIEDRAAFTRAMIEELISYPTDILEQAVRRARRTMPWVPSVSEMVTICDELIADRKLRLDAVEQMEREHRRRKFVAEQKAELEAKRQDQLRALEAQAIANFDKEAPLPGDIELANDLLLQPLVRRAGKPASWRVALANAEPWAAKFCRQIALAARVIRAFREGRVSHDHAVTAAKLIVNDEANTKRQIEDMEVRSATDLGSEPTVHLWDGVRAIEVACGVDTLVFPGDFNADANSAALLAHLESLADTRAILDRETQKEWVGKHGPVTSEADARGRA